MMVETECKLLGITQMETLWLHRVWVIPPCQPLGNPTLPAQEHGGGMDEYTKKGPCPVKNLEASMS